MTLFQRSRSMRIDSYQLGSVVINGTAYDSDCLILGESVRAGWWRKQGHSLQVEDLPTLLEHHPRVLIVGTGYSGVLKVEQEVERALQSRGIELVVARTEDACHEFNARGGGRGVVAALHLTC